MARAYAMLARRADFARVTRRGSRRSAAHLSVFVGQAKGQTRIGLTVGGNVGGAVLRNRLRRRLKAVLDTYPFDAPPWREIVIIARPGAAELSFTALRGELECALPR